ncbi:MAG: hypothetical protein COS14_03900 [Bacteroidetes bacterium CG02_land_8_20_14_3_00_31_25]|nr:MAG: hypothetical protein COS14_03900 [Bacteroidetes bacterium CG02_land_8_20_14_3_00_31_25]
MFKKLCIIFFFIFNILYLFSQDTIFNKFSIGLNERYGFIIPHRSSLVYIIEDHVKSWDITLSYRTNGNKPWHALYRTPELGIGFYHANLGNPNYLGKVSAIYGYIVIPIKKYKIIDFSYNIGTGVALLSNHFNYIDNIYNIAIGSQANAYIDFGLSAKFKILNNLSVSSGLQYTHYSNGAWRKPNLGFNIPSVNLKLFYSFYKSHEPEKSKVEDLKSNFIKKNEYSVTISKGVRENAPPNGEKFYPTAICLKAERLVTLRRKIGTGLDVFYDPSLKSRIEDDSITFKNIYNFRSGIHLSHDLVFNKVSITMQAGVYFFTKAKDDGLIYSRFGLRAKIYKNLTTSLTLKTHFVKADVIEWGIGYSFNK